MVAGPHVDHVGDAADLSRFPDETFQELYASHVLEHFDYVRQLIPVLKEWQRILRNGGTIYVSVPDLETLAEMILDDQLSFRDRFYVMRMMFGGHSNEFDFHHVSFTKEFLRHYLHTAGFRNAQRVETFGIFRDTSGRLYHNRLISLNMKAKKFSK